LIVIHYIYPGSGCTPRLLRCFLGIPGFGNLLLLVDFSLC